MHFNQFLQYISSEKRYSNHTLKAYTSDLEQFFSYLGSQYDIQQAALVTAPMVRSWIMSKMDQNLSATSVNRKISSLKSYFRYLVREGVIEVNPMTKVLPPKTVKALPAFVNVKQMDLLFEEGFFDDDFEGQRNKLIIEMFYFTGIRLSELVGLRNKSIDLNSQQIKVLGKRNKERLIPFGITLGNSIKKYLEMRTIKFGGSSPSESFFLTSKGTNIYQKLVYRVVNSYLSKVSTLKKTSPHLLRHTFATHMLNNGADLNAIKEILGHANLSATQIYTHNTIDKLKSIYNQAHPRA